jgi:hypothetical protein
MTISAMSVDSVINKAVGQCDLRWGATLLCKPPDCEYPLTEGALYLLGYALFVDPCKVYFRAHHGMTVHREFARS